MLLFPMLKLVYVKGLNNFFSLSYSYNSTVNVPLYNKCIVSIVRLCLNCSNLLFLLNNHIPHALITICDPFIIPFLLVGNDMK